MQNKRSGLHVQEAITKPDTDPLRKQREESIASFEQTGKKAQEWTEVRYFCNTDSMANKFAASAVFQQELTERENAKTQALRDARTDIKAIPNGAYIPRTVPVMLLDGPGDRLRVKEHINDRERCINVVNGEAGFTNARVEMLGYGDKVVGGLINKQDLEPAPTGKCDLDMAKMKQRTENFSLRPPASAATATPPVAPATGTPQQGPSSPSAPARVTFAPSSYSFDKQLEHYGFTGNGQQPVYEGRIALNAGSLLANVGGEPNDKGVRSLRDIKHGECVLTVNFGKSVLNHWPVYVQSAPQSLTGGWYQGNFGAKCDL